MSDPAGPVATGGRMTPRARALAILGGVLAALVVALLLLTLGGDDEEPDRAAPTPRPPITTSPTPGETPPAETDEAFEGKDPFAPLVLPVDAGPGGGPFDPGGGPGPGGTPTPGESRVAGGTDGERAHRVTLLDIFEDDGERFATVDVDDEEFNVQEGDTFAESFRVLDLTSKCGTFVFGDERFTLCLGQEVLK